MAKKENSFKNLVLTLLVITLLASTGLGYVYELTKGPIEQAKLVKKLEAIKEVTPAFDNDPNSEMLKMATPDGKDSLEIYPAKKGEEIIGYAVKTYTMKGFSGFIQLMVGFDTKGSIINISVLEHTETPGLGDKMSKSKSPWSNQFNGKNPATHNLKVKQDGGEIDAITASTISSRAYIDAVNRAFLTVQPLLTTNK